MASFHSPTPRARPLVMVSGCYDLLHSGHVAFFKQASELGDLFVSIGSDKNILLLKHHLPMFPEDERLYMVKAIRHVHDAQICRGSGMLDFEADLDVVKPDVFFVNEDGDRDTKRAACQARGIKYIVGERLPDAGLHVRSSTSIKGALTAKQTHKEEEKAVVYDDNEDNELNSFPWRVCLAGGWLDQPQYSAIQPGPVIVVNICPHEQFKTRSGLATSTRFVGMDLWGTKNKDGKPPKDVDNIQLAKLLFGAENPPGCDYVAGSQDALGLMLPGINRLDYDGSYWPASITCVNGHQGSDGARICSWLESVLWLVPLPSRPDGYNPLTIDNATEESVSLLAQASNDAWDAIQETNAKKLGAALKSTMKAWASMLPNTVPQPMSDEWCQPYQHTHGYLFSGAGGGFLMVVSESPVENGFQVKINSDNFWGA